MLSVDSVVGEHHTKHVLASHSIRHMFVVEDSPHKTMMSGLMSIISLGY
jgi:hypothetical protein